MKLNFRLITENKTQLIYIPEEEKAFFTTIGGVFLGVADQATWRKFINFSNIEIFESHTTEDLQLPEFIHIQSAKLKDNKVVFRYGKRRFNVNLNHKLKSEYKDLNKPYQIAIKVGKRIYILPQTSKANHRKVNGNLLILPYTWEEII